MTRRLLHPVSFAFVVTMAVAAGLVMRPASATAQNPAQQLVDDAAAAMGGRDRIMAARALTIAGGGHDLEFDQGFRFDELGMTSDIRQIRDYTRSYDLVNNRSRTELVREAQYAFFRGTDPAVDIQALDNHIAFNVAPNGTPTRVFPEAQVTARRVDYLRHPLTLIRAALAPGAALGNLRSEGGERLVDLKTEAFTVTIAFDATTKLPARLIHMVDSATLGDRPMETRFTDYRQIGGLQLPTRLISRADRFPWADLRIVRQSIDGDVGNLAAPPAVASAPRPAPPQPPGTPTREIAKGIWEVAGTTHKSYLVEFSDHLMIVDAPNVERTLAVLAKAKEIRPAKPVTKLLVGHHHGDHTGGIRTAVASGVTELLTHRSNVPLMNEIFKRPHTINPDLYSKMANPKPPKITAIDDQGVVRDAAMTINLYHLLDNSHSATQLMIYFPRERIVTVADVYMPGDPRSIVDGEPLGHNPWIRNVLANINYRKIQVDTMAPIHGRITPYSEFLEQAIFVTGQVPVVDPSTR